VEAVVLAVDIESRFQHSSSHTDPQAREVELSLQVDGHYLGTHSNKRMQPTSVDTQPCKRLFHLRSCYSDINKLDYQSRKGSRIRGSGNLL
jgi:hypothetical protein